MPYLLQDSTNAGEFSPKMAGNVTFEKYRFGCSKMENFIALPQGPAQSRPGFKYIATAGADFAMMRPFIASASQAFALEFGNEYLNIYQNQALLVAGIVTPYAAADIPSLQFSQLNDVMWIWHPSYPPMQLSWTGGANFTLSVAQWLNGPYLDETTTQGVQLKCSAGSGTGVTITAQYRGTTADYDTSALTAAANESCLSSSAPYAAFRFQTGASVGELLSAALTLAQASTSSGNTATAWLYSDNAGSPGVNLGQSTNTPSITTAGLVSFAFANEALAANRWYWICFSAATNDSNIQFVCVTSAAGFGSGVSAGSFAAITDSMGKDFSATVYYQPTGGAAIFEAGHVGSVWAIYHTGGSVTSTINKTGSQPALELYGEFFVDISATTDWAGQINLEISYDTITWFNAGVFTTSTEQSFYENRTGVWYRLNCKSFQAGSAVCVIYQVQNAGVFQITGFVSSSQVTANVTSIILTPTTWTPFWQEAAWSGVRGYPACGCFRGGRLYAAATPYQPTNIWGTWVADLLNFSPGDTDDAPVTFEITDFSNPIQWLASAADFLCGTMAEEATLASSQQASVAITPSNSVNPQINTNYGTQPGTRPIRIGPGLVFVQLGGMRLRAMSYLFVTNQYEADDLTLYADHVLKPGVVDMAYQQEPYQVVWCVRSDGVLAGLTYYPKEKVFGWHRHITAGQVLSVATIPSVSGDTAGRTELWVTVERTIAGKSVTTVEVLADFEGVKTQADYVCLDCAIIHDHDQPVNGLTSLNFYEGQTVSVIGDGAPQTPKTVVGGAIALDSPAAKVIVGLPYTPKLQTLDIEGGAMNGTSQTRMREVEKVTLRVLNSWMGGVVIGLDEASAQPIFSDWFFNSTQLDSAPPLFTGDTDIDSGWPSNSGKKLTAYIAQTQPAPLCVCAIIPKAKVGE